MNTKNNSNCDCQQHTERMEMKPSNNSQPQLHSKDNAPDTQVGIFDFRFNRPSPTRSALEESGRTSDTTTTTDCCDSQQKQQQKGDNMTVNNSNSDSNDDDGDVVSKRQPLHKQDVQNSEKALHESLSSELSNKLSSLRSTTQQAIQISYMEQERLSDDINSMQSRITYLKRKIGAARQELITKGGDDMSEKLMRLSLVKEVDSVDMSDAGGDNNEKYDFEVTYEAFKPNDNLNTFSGNNASKRGMLSTTLGSHNSELSSAAPSSHDESDVVSGSSSIFRITIGGIDGMPSRWRAREIEREKSEKMEVAQKNSSRNLTKDDVVSSNTTNDDNDKDVDEHAVDDDNHETATEKNTKEQQLITLKQLVTERESEISFLEKEMMNVDKEKTCLEDEISAMLRKREESKSGTNMGKGDLCEVIDSCRVHNHKLEKELLEETVALSVKQMNVELLAGELRDARKEFIQIQNIKDREKRESRRQERIGSPFESTSQSSHSSRVVRYEVPTNGFEAKQDAGRRSSGYTRNSSYLSNSSLSMESVVSMISAISADFGDLVDVLEDIDRSPR